MEKRRKEIIAIIILTAIIVLVSYTFFDTYKRIQELNKIEELEKNFCISNTTKNIVYAQECYYIGNNECKCCITPANYTQVCKIYTINYDTNSGFMQLIAK